MEGTRFGQYELLELLGRGGMGEVWRCTDLEENRVVATILGAASEIIDEADRRLVRTIST